MKKLLRICLCILAACMLALGIWGLFQYYMESHSRQKADGSLQQLVISDVPGSVRETTPETRPRESCPTAPIQVDFAALAQQCPDAVAWLYCPDTKIHSPVVQGADNGTYLHRSPEGRSTAAGSLFLDSQNAGDFGDLNSVIYGHHMKDGTMFGSLTRYREAAYREEHDTFWLLTPNGDWQCRILAGAVIPVTDGLYDFPQTKEKLQQVIDSREFGPGGTIQEGTPYLTLSTCSYEYENARFVLILEMLPCAGGEMR